MSVAAQDGATVLPVNQRQIMGAVMASCMGWALDLFDLFVLLYVAPIVGRLFFPSEHAMLSLAAVYASFAVTLLMRPLGSALFGLLMARSCARVLRQVSRRASPACRGRGPSGESRVELQETW